MSGGFFNFVDQSLKLEFEDMYDDMTLKDKEFVKDLVTTCTDMLHDVDYYESGDISLVNNYFDNIIDELKTIIKKYYAKSNIKSEVLKLATSFNDIKTVALSNFNRPKMYVNDDVVNSELLINMIKEKDTISTHELLDFIDLIKNSKEDDDKSLDKTIDIKDHKTNESLDKTKTNESLDSTKTKDKTKDNIGTLLDLCYNSISDFVESKVQFYGDSILDTSDMLSKRYFKDIPIDEVLDVMIGIKINRLVHKFKNNQDETDTLCDLLSYRWIRDNWKTYCTFFMKD